MKTSLRGGREKYLSLWQQKNENNIFAFVMIMIRFAVALIPGQKPRRADRCHILYIVMFAIVPRSFLSLGILTFFSFIFSP